MKNNRKFKNKFPHKLNKIPKNKNPIIDRNSNSKSQNKIK